MARPYHPYDEQRHGKLSVQIGADADCVEVYYTPSSEQLKQASIDLAEGTRATRIKLLAIDRNIGRLTMFPINTLGKRADFLESKYNEIKMITLEGAKPVMDISTGDDGSVTYRETITFGPTKPLEDIIGDDDVSDDPVSVDDVKQILEDLPPAFTKDYDYGLGLAKSYQFIIDAIEALSRCTEVLISPDRETGIDEEGRVFCISIRDFEDIRKQLNRTTALSRSAVRSVKASEAYNFFADKIGRPRVPVRMGRHPLRKLFTAALQSDGEVLSSQEQEEILGVMARNVRPIAGSRPDKLASLQRDIELVKLEGLIVRFDKMMARQTPEEEWQAFFNENPFVLTMAFGHPVIKVQDKASVGGRTFSGKGGKITDFLVKNSMTNNTAIVEIKTPQTELLGKKEYRGEVFGPSADVSGAINQVLDQKYRFDREIAQFKENSQLYDLRSYSVYCCLIVGTIPMEEDRRKSFELFRGNSKDVEILTFDELLKKLDGLRQFLSSPETAVAGNKACDVPF